MQVTIKIATAVLSMLLGLSFVSAQTVEKKAAEVNPGPTVTDQPNEGPSEPAASAAPTSEPTVSIYLIDGRKLEVDEVTKTADGIWYTRNNISTFLDSARVKKIEHSDDRPPTSRAAVVAGSGRWQITDAARVEDFFMSRFKRPLPLTAFGQSDLHTRWGLDHRNGMDVGLHPDSIEGKALIKFLTGEEIPFLAFRSSVPGVATGPHIHVGNGSHRLHSR